MSTTPTEPIQRLEFPTALSTKISSTDVFLCRNRFRQLTLTWTWNSKFWWSHAWECLLNEQLRMLSTYRHILRNFNFFCFRLNILESGICFLCHRSSDLEFLRRGTWTLNWGCYSNFNRFLNLHLFNCEWSRFIHDVLAHWYVTLGCSLVEIALTMRTRDIREHLASSINVRMLPCGSGPLLFGLVWLTVSSDMLPLILGCNWPYSGDIFWLRIDKRFRKCLVHDFKSLFCFIPKERVVVGVLNSFSFDLMSSWLVYSALRLVKFRIKSKIWLNNHLVLI